MVLEGKSKIVLATPTLDTSAYASGDRVGSIMEFVGAMDTSSDTGNILSITILDRAALTAALTLLLFKDLPTIASADNAALNITDAEMDKCIGWIPIATADYISATAATIATVRNVNLLVGAVKSQTNPTGTSLFGVLRTTGTPTYAANSLTVSLCIKQD